MNEIDDFRNWLDSNTEYTTATKSNIISRLKRANKILPFSTDPIYLFQLSQNEEFNALSISVKSQIRRAIRIFSDFKKD